MDISKINYSEIAGKFNLTDASFDTYDVNKDGKINEEDIAATSNAAIKNTIKQLLAAADDESTLEKAGETSSSSNDQITEENAETVAAQIIASVTNGTNNPEYAKTLNELQRMTATLTKQIEQSAVLVQLLEAKIKKQDEELKKIEEEKEATTKEYADKEGEVAAKSDELSAKMVSILSISNRINAEREAQTTILIKTCIADYKDGKYPSQTLASVIQSKLATEGGYDTYPLASALAGADSLGSEIKALCSELDDLVGGIKSITEKYNAKTAERNTTNGLFTGITDAATKANQQYQSGYEKREAMRKEIIEKYSVKGDNSVVDTNPQLQKLDEFLDNKELDNMPFADAWAILTETFNACGIGYNKNTGAISIPHGHNAGAKNIYDALQDALTRNYKNRITRDDDEGLEDDDAPAAGGVTTIARTDPITFTNGDIKYDFIKDHNKNGVLDDATEFLGAKNGWEEMKAYDKDGDGKISGDELKNITLAATNQTNGQFTFVSAQEAGIESIDLNSFKSLNQKEINKDVTVGTFEVKMTDGQIIEGKQTEDTNRNIANTYSTMFGNKIEDRTGAYDDNPFMEEFVETTDTDFVISSSEENIESTELESDIILRMGKNRIEQKAQSEAAEGERQKAAADAKAEKERKAAEKKEAAKKEEAQAEENKKAEKKETAQKAAAKKSSSKKV